ncbi:hypothetical protein Dimus_009578 [Dionaea muscipula]
MSMFDTISNDGEEPTARPFDEDPYPPGYDTTSSSGASAQQFGLPPGFSSPTYAFPTTTLDDDDNNAAAATTFQDSPDPYAFDSSISASADYSPSPFSSDSLIPEANGHAAAKPLDEGLFSSSDGPVLPPPSEMHPEEGAAFREWRRQNAIHLEEKENREKEMLNQIINEANEYKRSFYEKRKVNIEASKNQNREREKLYLLHQEKFHKEADQQYWKAIAELIPREVPNIEKRRGKKDPDSKPSIAVIQGPKPGKPTDLTRMRQVLLKLKQNAPPHMLPPPPPAKDGKDAKNAKEGKDAKGDTKDVKKDAGEEKDADNGKDNLPTSGKEAAVDKPTSPVKDIANGVAEDVVAGVDNGAVHGVAGESKPEVPASVEGEQPAETEPAASAE